MKRNQIWTALGLAIAFLAPAAVAGETIELKPDERASWSPAQLFAWVRPGHNFGERKLEIESVPTGASLDLFYVRASFQKRYEQAFAPVTVLLPKRIEAGKRDSVTIRAFLEGHKLQTMTIPVRGKQEHIVIDMEPLPNLLVGASHTYFAGRAGLALLTKEQPTVRVQDGKSSFTVILAQTARKPGVNEVLGEIRSPLVDLIEGQQIGEDLLVKVDLAEQVRSDQLELRSRQRHDPVRDLHTFAVDMIPAGEGAATAVERARDTLQKIVGADVTGCNAAFDDALRGELDREQLARALRPRGEFTDPYLRTALRRLGEVSPGGVIRVGEDREFRPGIPLELAAAASEAWQARGYLALLRRWVQLLEPREYRQEALRSLLAPELAIDRFASALGRAESAERRCRGTTASR